MELSCKKCKQKFYVPDDKLVDRRVYFFCEKCGHKIVIESRKDSWSSYKGFNSANLSGKDILEGIFYSFNLKNILFSFLILFIFLIFIGLFSFIVYENVPFFMGHPYFSGILFFIILIFVMLIFDMHLYLLSKNTINRIKNDINIQFSAIKSDIFNDLKSIFILSSGLLIFYFLLLLPINPLKRFGLIYSGSIFLFLILVSFSIIIVQYLKNIIYAFIALKSRSFGYTFHSIFKFLAIENINIPIYMVFINIITAILYSGILFIVISGFSMTGYFIFKLLNVTITNDFNINIFSFADIISKVMSHGYSNLPVSISFGIVMISIIFILISLLVIAYFINLYQSLCVVSVFIMESNPGKSLNRNIILLTMFLLLLLPILFYSIFFLKF